MPPLNGYVNAAVTRYENYYTAILLIIGLTQLGSYRSDGGKQ
jgi:hypothetical protein